ncbi:MAG: hypothetical protein R2772_04805 [Chitinophagales bacterium]
MNYKKLKKTLYTSYLKISIIGTIVLFFGMAIIVRPLLGSKGNLPISLIFGGLCIALGIAVLYTAIPAFIKAINDRDPILHAIHAGKKDFLVWVYRKEIHTSLSNTGESIGYTNNIGIFTKESKGKGFELIMSDTQSAEAMIAYLRSEFEIPYIGYTDKNRAEINKYFSLEGSKRV